MVMNLNFDLLKNDLFYKYFIKKYIFKGHIKIFVLGLLICWAGPDQEWVADLLFERKGHQKSALVEEAWCQKMKTPMIWS